MPSTHNTLEIARRKLYSFLDGFSGNANQHCRGFELKITFVLNSGIFDYNTMLYKLKKCTLYIPKRVIAFVFHEISIVI